MCTLSFKNFEKENTVHCCDVADRVPAFQPDGPDSIPGGVRNLNLYPGIECVFFVLSCVVSGVGPDILLTRDSGRLAMCMSSVLVLVHSLYSPKGN